jgi:hypothetical protein
MTRLLDDSYSFELGSVYLACNWLLQLAVASFASHGVSDACDGLIAPGGLVRVRRFVTLQFHDLTFLHRLVIASAVPENSRCAFWAQIVKGWLAFVTAQHT